MVEYKIKLEGSDGKSYVITYAGLWETLRRFGSYEGRSGWNDITRKLRDDITELCDLLLDGVLVPKAKDAILAFLKENPNVQTRSFYDKDWSFGLRSNAWYHARDELEAEGKIVSERHGQGQNRTWKLSQSG